MSAGLSSKVHGQRRSVVSWCGASERPLPATGTPSWTVHWRPTRTGGEQRNGGPDCVMVGGVCVAGIWHPPRARGRRCQLTTQSIRRDRYFSAVVGRGSSAIPAAHLVAHSQPVPHRSCHNACRSPVISTSSSVMRCPGALNFARLLPHHPAGHRGSVHERHIRVAMRR